MSVAILAQAILAQGMFDQVFPNEHHMPQVGMTVGMPL